MVGGMVDRAYPGYGQCGWRRGAAAGAGPAAAASRGTHAGRLSRHALPHRSRCASRRILYVHNL